MNCMLRLATIARCCRGHQKAGNFFINRIRYESTVILRRPPASLPREAPTPLVFAYAKGWYEDEVKEYCLVNLECRGL